MNPQVWQDLKETLRTVLGESRWEEALGLNPEALSVLIPMARQLAEQGRLDEAQALFEGLVVLYPQEAYLHTALGCVYMRKGWTEDAIAAFQCALNRDPADVAAHTYLGELHLARGEVEAALRHLAQAVGLDSTGTDPYANRARLLSGLVAVLARTGVDGTSTDKPETDAFLS
ncbi:MAG: tetratricopeptide repeat protein [Acidobacteria bacterium]|nr:tetratricopeptide repeat protein [Acidobacteriota bacterium]MDW7983147.1 tetratricopeptide repeat protein [Acidobacteriota bacterium]